MATVTFDMGNATTDATTTSYTGQVTWPTAVAIFMAVVAVLGTIGNIFIIGAVCLQKRLRVSSNIFIVNLAVVDLIITAYIMPIGIATSQYKVTPFSDIICEINAFLITTTCGVSTQTLMLIAIERYFHICRFAQYKKVFSTNLIAVYTAITWIYTAIWACQGWTGWTIFLYGADTYICTFHGPYSLSYVICLAIFGMLLPIAALVFSYVSIFKTAWKSRNAVGARRGQHGTKPKIHSREYNLIITLFTIVVVFIIFWSPAAIVLVMAAVVEIPVVTYTVTIWIALCNSVMNSIIYGTMNRNFRNGYIQLGRHIFCCFIDRKTKKCKCCKCCLITKEETGSTSQGKEVGSGGSDFSQISKQSINTQVSAVSRDVPLQNRVQSCDDNKCKISGNDHDENASGGIVSMESVVTYSEIVVESQL